MILSALRSQEKLNKEISVEAHKYDIDGKTVLAF